MIADEATFARLMASAQNGDKAGYNMLLSEAGMWLERYFRRREPPHQLDDLVQDVLMALHAKRATYDPARPFLPWLAAIARYRWVDHLRKVYKHEAQEIDTIIDEVLTYSCPMRDFVANICSCLTNHNSIVVLEWHSEVQHLME